MSTYDPRAEYLSRLNARRETVARYEQRDLRAAQARGALVLAALALALLSYWLQMLSAWWLVVPSLAFVALAIWHDRVIRAKQHAGRAVTFYENGLARIDDTWMGRGQSTELFADDSHLYSADLDLFGKDSLFELLCTARTRSGEEALAAWLIAPASRDEILRRQQAVEELRGRVDLREDLAILGPEIRSSIHPATMAAWGGMPEQLRGPWPRAGAVLVSATLWIAMVVTWFPDTGSLWGRMFVGSLIAAALYAFLLRSRVHRVLSAVEGPKRDLELLALLLARIEREPCTAPALLDLQARLVTEGIPPSRQIARLVRLVDLIRMNRLDSFIALVAYLAHAALFAPFSFSLWSTQIACAVENWRRTNGTRIADWLAVTGEFEALCALAGYAYEHPGNPFPEIVAAGAVFDGEQLRHPLLPAARCVANSVRLDDSPRLLVVSGSNMSGKSTLLRTVGVNTVLALAGAPVRAARLRVSPFALGATLRIQDSLQAGTSRFYAEIQRIRHVTDLTTGPRPVLFLLDEILHGTNSHDRAIGAEAIVRGLIDRGAVGLVTTHDLALTRVADALAPRAANVHFADEFRDGQLHFDYRMQPGVVTKSNALELMRAVGLKVNI